MHRPKVGAEWSSERTTVRPLGSCLRVVGGRQSWARVARGDATRARRRMRRGLVFNFIRLYLERILRLRRRSDAWASWGAAVLRPYQGTARDTLRGWAWVPLVRRRITAFVTGGCPAEVNSCESGCGN